MIRALYGGSFDPVHAGHLAVVAMLLDRQLADHVHVLPAWRSPLKSLACTIPGSARLQLVRLALAEEKRVSVDDREVLAEAPRFTVDTLAELVADHPDDRWRLVVGADHVPVFGRWHRPERLLELAELVVVARGPVELTPLLRGRAVVVDDFDHPAVSTRIRRELAAGRLPGPDVLPESVAAAIVAGGLYGWTDPKESP